MTTVSVFAAACFFVACSGDDDDSSGNGDDAGVQDAAKDRSSTRDTGNGNDTGVQDAGYERNKVDGPCVELGENCDTTPCCFGQCLPKVEPGTGVVDQICQ
jgi:hypothetical protein